MNLQRAGVAAFAVLTEPFADQVDRVMVYQSADRKLPVLVLPHPVQNISAEALKERAEKLADMVGRLLNGEWERA